MGLAAAWLAFVVLAIGFCASLRWWLGKPPDSPGPWRLALTRLRRDRAGMVAAYALITLYLLALLAPWLSPYNPIVQIDPAALASKPPSLAHPFGTDIYSRDVLSRVLHGARVSLGVGLLVALLSTSLGTAYGAVAGYVGGTVDGAMMRAIDTLLAIPRILLLLATLALWGRVSVPTLVLILGLTGWFGVSRLVRAEVLSIREREMVLAARALGGRARTILWRHVLPGTLATVIVAATLGVGNVIGLEAGLSFLGVGVRQPTPSWGNIMNDAMSDPAHLWWAMLFPGLAIIVTVMAFNMIGDALRDALDPREIVGG